MAGESRCKDLVDAGFTAVGEFIDGLRQPSTPQEALGKIAVVAKKAALLAQDLSGFVAVLADAPRNIGPFIVGYFLGAWMKPEIHEQMYSFTPPRMLMTVATVAGLAFGSYTTVAAAGGMFIFNRVCKLGFIQLKPARG